MVRMRRRASIVGMSTSHTHMPLSLYRSRHACCRVCGHVPCFACRVRSCYPGNTPSRPLSGFSAVKLVVYGWCTGGVRVVCVWCAWCTGGVRVVYGWHALVNVLDIGQCMSSSLEHGCPSHTSRCVFLLQQPLQQPLQKTMTLSCCLKRTQARRLLMCCRAPKCFRGIRHSGCKKP